MREKRSVPRAPELEGWRPRAQVRESFYIFSGWFGGGVATPVNLGFLGASRFGRENPHKSLLDFLGFPWILSSESRLINGLHAIFAERIFPRAFPLSFEARNGSPQSKRMREAQDCSWGKLNSISDYPQELVGSSRLGSKPERLYGGDRFGRADSGPWAASLLRRNRQAMRQIAAISRDTEGLNGSNRPFLARAP